MPEATGSDIEARVRPVVNAAGKMTYLGSSACSPEVVQALASGAQRWVDMDELTRVAGEAVAEATGAEAGLVVNSVAAGLAISAAASVTEGDPLLVEAVPNLPEGVNRRVVIQKGHAVHFGAPLATMLRVGGAEVDEIGSSNRCTAQLLESAMRIEAKAVYFVVSHHVGQSELVGLDDVIRVAHAANVPVVVDAAAETDLRGYVARGADLVLYSGHKAIGGPTSGVLCGRADLVAACAAQSVGIARAMKIGKESIFGLIAALAQYGDQDAAASRKMRGHADRLIEVLEGIPGLHAAPVHDDGRPIIRVRVRIDANVAGIPATELVAALAAGDPSVRCRAHHATDGYFDLDTRTLNAGDEDAIASAIRSVLSGRDGGEVDLRGMRQISGV